LQNRNVCPLIEYLVVSQSKPQNWKIKKHLLGFFWQLFCAKWRKSEVEKRTDWQENKQKSLDGLKKVFFFPNNTCNSQHDDVTNVNVWKCDQRHDCSWIAVQNSRSKIGFCLSLCCKVTTHFSIDQCTYFRICHDIKMALGTFLYSFFLQAFY